MKFFNPLRVIGIWTAGVILINVIVLPILYYNTVGGEQRPLTFMINSLKIGAWGVFILSLVIPFINYSWFRKHWYINLAFLFISSIYLFQDLRSSGENIFGFDEKTKTVDGSEVRIRTEYYSVTPKKIRSLSYWKDGKKDSVWVTFSEDGKIIVKQVFKNDKLILETK